MIKSDRALSDMKTLAKSSSHDKKLFITIYQNLVEVEIPQVDLYSPNSDIDKAFKILCVGLIEKCYEKDYKNYKHKIHKLEKDEFVDFIDSFDENKSLKENLKTF